MNMDWTGTSSTSRGTFSALAVTLLRKLHIWISYSRRSSELNAMRWLSTVHFSTCSCCMVLWLIVHLDTSNQNQAQEATVKKKSLSIQPQYNICEHYLNANTFVHVLKTCCPNIVVGTAFLLSLPFCDSTNRFCLFRRRLINTCPRG